MFGPWDRSLWLTFTLFSFQFHIHLQPQGESKHIWRRSIFPVRGEFPGDLRGLICHGVCICCCHGTDILCPCVGSWGPLRAGHILGMFLRTNKLQTRKRLDGLVQGWHPYSTTGPFWLWSVGWWKREGPRLFPFPRPVLGLLILSDPRISAVLKNSHLRT